MNVVSKLDGTVQETVFCYKAPEWPDLGGFSWLPSPGF